MAERLKIAAIDPHAHLRGGEESHKEDVSSGTRAAVAGGYTTVLDMPNNSPPALTIEDLEAKNALASDQTYCFYLPFVAGTLSNTAEANKASQIAAGLKIYMDDTHGKLFVRDLEALNTLFKRWCGPGPICVHAEGISLASAIGLSASHHKPLHICHVSTKAEIDLIREAKEAGHLVTCEVTPHHLFLTDEDAKALGPLGYMKPELKPKKDVAALWADLDVIDCLATDHAPHTLEEKHSDNPPPGVPGLETAIPLMLQAVAERRLTLEKFISMVSDRPREIFKLPNVPDTYAEIDLQQSYYIDPKNLNTRVGWTPFEGYRMQGAVLKVVVNNQIVYNDGEHFEPDDRNQLIIKR